MSICLMQNRQCCITSCATKTKSETLFFFMERNTRWSWYLYFWQEPACYSIAEIGTTALKERQGKTQVLICAELHENKNKCVFICVEQPTYLLLLPHLCIMLHHHIIIAQKEETKPNTGYIPHGQCKHCCLQHLLLCTAITNENPLLSRKDLIVHDI